jgi:hypothetical protein
MASFIAIIRYALLETFFCISILAKTDSCCVCSADNRNYGLVRCAWNGTRPKILYIGFDSFDWMQNRAFIRG